MMKKRGNARPARSHPLPGQTKHGRSENGGKFAGQTVQTEKFRLPPPGNQPAEYGPAQRLASSLHPSDHDRQDIKVQSRLHKITEDDNDEVNNQGEDQCGFGTPADGQFPEEERAGNPDELCQEQSDDEIGLMNANFHTINGCHFDDGVDPVAVKPKSDQKFQEFRVFPCTFEGCR